MKTSLKAILLFDSFKKSIKQVEQNLFDYFFMFTQLVFFSRNIKWIYDDRCLLLNLLFVIIVAIIKKKIKNDNSILYLTILYFLIIGITAIITPSDIIVVFGFYVRLLTAYFIISYYSNNFYVIFENSIFILAYISIPLFLIQISFPNFYNFLIPFSNKVLVPEVVNEGNFRYMLIFLVNNWGDGVSYRNSGFMSEPSAFASVLSWASMINLGLNNFKINKKLLVFIIAFITTFSTGGFIYLLLIFCVICLSNINYRKSLIMSILSILFIGFIAFFIINNTKFGKNNLDDTIIKLSMQKYNEEMVISGIAENGEVSRVTGAKVNFKLFLQNPLGYGFGKSGINKYEGDSPNGLSVLLFRFGLFFLIIMFISSYKMADNLLSMYNCSRISYILYMLLLILPSAGFSFVNQPFLWVLFLYPLFSKTIRCQKIKYLLYNNISNNYDIINHK